MGKGVKRNTTGVCPWTLFIIFINDLVESCGQDANIYLFADDAKVYQHILANEDELNSKQCSVAPTFYRAWELEALDYGIGECDIASCYAIILSVSQSVCL